MRRSTDDVQRLRSLPAAALEELHEYIRQVRNGLVRSARACIRLDRSTMGCRYYEYRPMICRDLEIGSDNYVGWREVYQIGQ